MYDALWNPVLFVIYIAEQREIGLGLNIHTSSSSIASSLMKLPSNLVETGSERRTIKSAESETGVPLSAPITANRAEQNGYRLLKRSGLFVQVLPFAHSILSRFTSP